MTNQRESRERPEDARRREILWKLREAEKATEQGLAYVRAARLHLETLAVGPVRLDLHAVAAVLEASDHPDARGLLDQCRAVFRGVSPTRSRAAKQRRRDDQGRFVPTLHQVDRLRLEPTIQSTKEAVRGEVRRRDD